MLSARGFILATLMAAPALCLAEPAVIRVFEAQARSAPNRSAPVVHLFVEGARVSVSEEATEGWRKVRLPDGGVAFIEEKALAFPDRPAALPSAAPGPAAAVSATPVPVAAASPAPEGFAWAVTRTATKLRSIPDASGSLLHEIASGTAVLVSVEVVRGFMDPTGDVGRGAFVAGLGVGALSILIAWLIYPGRTAFLEAVNEWNARHPDRQFDLTVPGSPRQVALPPAPARDAPPGLTRVSGLALAF